MGKSPSNSKPSPLFSLPPSLSFCPLPSKVFEGNLTVFLSGAPSKSTMVVFCNLFYAFMIIF